MIILISDNSDYIAKFSNTVSAKSQLLNLSNYQSDLVGCYYTSLADMPPDVLLPVCLEADEVVYYPPPDWESEDLKKHTLLFLDTLVNVHRLEVHGFNANKRSILDLQSSRKTNDPQLWIAGCSYAVGRGLFNRQDRYGVKLSQMLDKSYSDLCELSASIDWAADQILRADLRPGDILTWGITSPNRLSYFVNNSLWFATVSTVQGLDTKEQDFFQKLITDDNIVYQSIRKIKQVINVCNKLNVKLVLFYHDIGLKAHNSIMLEYLASEPSFLKLSDRVDDSPGSKLHPGPISHQMWANDIFNFLKSD